jgi:hypothetical protein
MTCRWTPCAILAVWGHNKNKDNTDLCGFSVSSEYYYIGILIDNSGNLEPQLNKIKKLYRYQFINLKYYVQHLLYENQYLLW